jgi:hypothetical protein
MSCDVALLWVKESESTRDRHLVTSCFKASPITEFDSNCGRDNPSLNTEDISDSKASNKPGEGRVEIGMSATEELSVPRTGLKIVDRRGTSCFTALTLHNEMERSWICVMDLVKSVVDISKIVT